LLVGDDYATRVPDSSSREQNLGVAEIPNAGTIG
jgi:hypothetical protein